MDTQIYMEPQIDPLIDPQMDTQMDTHMDPPNGPKVLSSPSPQSGILLHFLKNKTKND